MKRCLSCFRLYEDQYTVCPYCGTAEIKKPVEPIQLYPGTVLANRYILGTAVGAGGFGIVYRAWDSKLETIVAVKEFFVSRLMTRAEGLKTVIVSQKNQAEFNYRKERFLAEARNMARFGTHRSIPNVFEYFEENNTAYIVMELLQGMPLNEYLVKNGGAIDQDFALMITIEVGNALKSLHEAGIIHRDVAPDNIFICQGKDIRIKLMDLGAAKLADTSDDVVDIILKPGYSPAEQYDNSNNIGPWTDIYALGATLYMMLTGIKPDEATNRKIEDTLIPPNEINPNVSENLSNTIMKAMAIDIHMRFQNADDFLKAVNGEKKVVSLKTEKKRRNLKRLIGVVAAVVVLAVVFGFVFDSYQDKKKEVVLRDAAITVWFSVTENSSEEKAIDAIVDDFTSKFENVSVDYRAIPEEDYEKELRKALDEGHLPSLFESSGVSEDILAAANDLDKVLKTEQAKECYFLDQYTAYYSDIKQMPMGIAVPVAYVVTNGPTCIDYSDEFFEDLDSFGKNVNISADKDWEDMLFKNFGAFSYSAKEEFLDNVKNTSPVLLSSTMLMNTVRNEIINYEKSYVYCNAEKVYCDFVYEWSIGATDKNETAAAERLLSWMLGNVYQNYLMVSESSDGQIPLNPTCFFEKTGLRTLQPLREIYRKFTFER